LKVNKYWFKQYKNKVVSAKKNSPEGKFVFLKNILDIEKIIKNKKKLADSIDNKFVFFWNIFDIVKIIRNKIIYQSLFS
jgi:hypothetical protein